jgi:hypothetical protein
LNGGSAHRKAATYTQNNTNTQLTHTDTMLRVGFEPMIPVIEWAKTVQALDSAVTVIDSFHYILPKGSEYGVGNYIFLLTSYF